MSALVQLGGGSGVAGSAKGKRMVGGTSKQAKIRAMLGSPSQAHAPTPDAASSPARVQAAPVNVEHLAKVTFQGIILRAGRVPVPGGVWRLCRAWLCLQPCHERR